LNVNVITWNVAGIDVPDDLGILFNTKTLENIDIFAIGVQECSVFKINDWQKHLKTLMAYYGFLDVTSIHMCQMFLIVFIRSQYLPFVENVTSSYKPMGFAKIVGNKGGIGISFKLFGYIVTFINCHLAPKPYKVLERNNHAKNIVKYLRIGEKYADFDITSDYLFWEGDLNYRVDFSFDETLDEINKGNIKLLLLKDQLIKQRQTNQVFYDFQEPDINFNPTYRRKKGTDQYSNKKNQSPSWCDRIMVKTDRDVDLIHYDSVKEVRHRYN
jgi:hypothetical protein